MIKFVIRGQGLQRRWNVTKALARSGGQGHGQNVGLTVDQVGNNLASILNLEVLLGC